MAGDEVDSDHEYDQQDDNQEGRGGRGKGKSAKDLSHVPCKFFKVDACTAGAACPFSHSLGDPGRPKDVCAWFIKGNCKFGHKCALAHVLPGQPMSMDRKNKKAAQQAAGGSSGGGGGRDRGDRRRGGQGGGRDRDRERNDAPQNGRGSGSSGGGRGPGALTAMLSKSGAAPPVAVDVKASGGAEMVFDLDEHDASDRSAAPPAPQQQPAAGTQRNQSILRDPAVAAASGTGTSVPPATTAPTSTSAGGPPGLAGAAAPAAATPTPPGLTKGLAPPPGLAALGLGARPTAAAIVAGTATTSTTTTTSGGASDAARTSDLAKDSTTVRINTTAPTPGVGTPKRPGGDYGFGPIGSPPRGSPAGETGFPSSLGVPKSGLLRQPVGPGQGHGFAWRGVDIQGRGSSAVDDDDLEEALPSSLNELLSDNERERRWSRTGLGRPQLTADAGLHRYSRSVPAQNWMDQVGPNVPSPGTSAAASGIIGASLSPSNASGAFLGRGLRHPMTAGPGFGGVQHGQTQTHAAPFGPAHADYLSRSMGDRDFGEENDRVGALGAGLGALAVSPSSRALASFAPGQSLPQGLAAGASRIHMLGAGGGGGGGAGVGFSPGATSPSFGAFGMSTSPGGGGSAADNWRGGGGGGGALADSILRGGGVGTGRSVGATSGFSAANTSDNWRTGGGGDWARSPPGSLAGTGFASGMGMGGGLQTQTGAGMGPPPGLGVPTKKGPPGMAGISSPLARPVITNDQDDADDGLFEMD